MLKQQPAVFLQRVLLLEVLARVDLDGRNASAFELTIQLDHPPLVLGVYHQQIAELREKLLGSRGRLDHAVGLIGNVDLFEEFLLLRKAVGHLQRTQQRNVEVLAQQHLVL